MTEQIDMLKGELKTEIEKEAPNIEEITEKLVRDRMESAVKQYQYREE